MVTKRLLVQKVPAPLAVLMALAVAVPAPLAWAQKVPAPYASGDYGGMGLMQTPTARMNKEGEFSLHYSDTQEYRRMAATLQLYPWLEATARYTDIRYRLYSQFPGFSNDQSYKDKGFDVKLLLLQERDWLPQVAVGFRDLAGTGIFAGEYVVANKRFGDFDLSLGMGWGYLGRRDNIKNPFCEVADRFCDRTGGFTGSGGKFEIDKWFRGPAALFGGVNYYTPIDGLTLQAEYDPNDYQRDNAGRPIVVDSAWNVGAHYSYTDNLTFNLGYQRGNTLSFGFTLRTNFDTLWTPKTDLPARKAKLEQSPAQSLTDVDMQKLSADILTESGFVVTDVAEQQSTVTLYGYQSRFRDYENAVDRAARVLADTLPESIKRYEIAEVSRGFALVQHNVNATQFKAAYRGESMQAQATSDAITTSNVRRGAERIYSSNDNQAAEAIKFTYQFKPFINQAFGSPETFYFYQVGVMTNLNYQLEDNFDISGKIGVNLHNNYDEFNFLVDAYDEALPRVRTRIREYNVGTDVWIEELQANYSHQFTDNQYATLYAGYFERMFAGVGAEYLYRPLNSDIAVGIDVNYVKQRDPYSEFGLEDYSVVTGHASLYWDLPYVDDSKLILRAGRFLAKDVGTHIEFNHTFATGITAGAYAAFTNVSAEDYGEGSFTKGFYLTIPFDVLFTKSSKGSGGIAWSPLFRDGGQMLHRSRQLYYMTESRD
jgi:hypothetical protein